MKIILSVFGVIFLSVSSSAGIEEGELDRTGLECEVSYKDRGGKYQGQQGVTLPKA